MAKSGTIPRDEVERREAFVEDALAGLTPLAELYRAFRATFQTGQRTAERYVRRVHERWAAEPGADRAGKRREIERAADLAFRLARADNNPRAMVAALDLKAKLHGLDRPEADAATGDVAVVFECEPAPGDAAAVPAAADLAPGGDPPGHRALPGPGRG